MKEQIFILRLKYKQKYKQKQKYKHNNINKFMTNELKRLQTIVESLPETALIRFVRQRDTGKSYMEYVSSKFEKITEYPASMMLEDMTEFFKMVSGKNRDNLLKAISESEQNMTDIDIEVSYTKNNILYWLHIIASPHLEENSTVWDGFVRDITHRKVLEDQLMNDSYRSRLEKTVEEKTLEIVSQQRRLESISSRQSLLIKILRLIQSSDISTAMKLSLAEIGKHLELCHVYTFEKSADGDTVSATHEWNGVGKKLQENTLLNIPLENFHSWFEIFEMGDFICESDISSMSVGRSIRNIMQSIVIKSFVTMPLFANGSNYGFIIFDDCNKSRVWNYTEIDLLKTLSQIISSAIGKDRAEKEIGHSHQIMHAILNSLSSGIIVTDVKTSEILFANNKVNERIGHDVTGKICWQTITNGKTGVCEYCARPHLMAMEQGNTYKWEYFNEMDQRWYEEHSTLIEWIDGRMVHLENTIDITDHKKGTKKDSTKP